MDMVHPIERAKPKAGRLDADLPTASDAEVLTQFKFFATPAEL